MSIPSIILTSSGLPYITLKDWFRNAQQYGYKQEELTDLSFKLRQKSSTIRDTSAIETSLNQELTNDLLVHRMKEINEWKNVLEDNVQKIKQEREELLKEKINCEKQISGLHARFDIINECNALRCSRRREDMCSDAVDKGIFEECCLLERVKVELTDKCEEAYNCGIKLLELSGTLSVDIDLKRKAITIEQETLNLIDNPSFLTRKPDLDHEINYVSHSSWLENCKYLQSQGISLVGESKKLRNEMVRLRQQFHCQMLAQFDVTNFALRKRLFEVRYTLDELIWQKQTLEQEKEQLISEIEKIKQEKAAQINVLKLFESQNRNRIYRVANEFCQDNCTDNLEMQVIEARHRVEHLEKQMGCVKKTQFLLDQQIAALEKEIKAKNVAVVLDERCLTLRTESDFLKNSFKI